MVKKGYTPQQIMNKLREAELSMLKYIKDIPIQDKYILKPFNQFLGQKFTSVIEHFRPLVRNTVAHLDPS